MSHPLVNQLRFARSEFQRCLADVSQEDALLRIGQMNCISWIIGHLANQEHRNFVTRAQGKDLFPGLNDLVGYGKPASTPPLAEMWHTWQVATAEADVFLDTINGKDLGSYLETSPGVILSENLGLNILRVTYHYWFHTGEAHAIRQMLGHTDLPQFVGDMSEVVLR